MDNNNVNMELLLAQIQALTAENASLKANSQAKKAGSKIRVSEKGAVSVYGLGRFPITLYQSQWVKLFGMIEEVKSFIEENKAALTEKPAA